MKSSTLAALGLAAACLAGVAHAQTPPPAPSLSAEEQQRRAAALSASLAPLVSKTSEEQSEAQLRIADRLAVVSKSDAQAHYLLRGVFFVSNWLPYEIDRSEIIEAWLEGIAAICNHGPSAPPIGLLAPSARFDLAPLLRAIR